MKKTWPLVSIIIANWNGGDVFKDCLYSLKKIDYPNWELIIVDNGSNDGSEKYSKGVINFAKKIKVIKNRTNLGFAPANNQGVKVAKGEFILCLNNDTKVSKNFLTLLVEKMLADPTVGIIQPKIYLMDSPGYLDNAGSFFTKIGFLDHFGFLQKDSPKFNLEKEIFSAKGACMLIRAEVLHKTNGLFDSDFFSYFEESDLCFRVWISGYKVIFYPKSKIYHKLGYTIKRLDVLNINYHYYKNRICSLIKNLQFKNFHILFNHLVISIIIALLFLLRLNIRNFFLIFKAIFWNLENLSRTLDKRRMIQQGRQVSDSKIFKNVSRPINWNKFFNDFKRVEKDIKNQ